MKGVYLLGYIETRNKRLLKSTEHIKNAVLKVCKIVGLNVVNEKYHTFKSPKGITYCFFLSQSHFIIHTWPEESKIFFDIFTCNKDLDKKECINTLSKKFKGKVKEIRKIKHR